MYHQRAGLRSLACYKPALIDLEARWGDKAEMIELCMKCNELFQAECWNDHHLRICQSCRERLKRVGIGNDEAKVRSANIDEIAETNRND
jgi:hypothetical protein